MKSFLEIGVGIQAISFAHQFYVANKPYVCYVLKAFRHQHKVQIINTRCQNIRKLIKKMFFLNVMGGKKLTTKNKIFVWKV